MVRTIAPLFCVMSIIATGAFATPISYNIGFTTTFGLPPASGSFTYDSAAPLTNRFTNFNVVWNTLTFDFTSVANTGENFIGTDCGTTPSSQSVFTFLSGQNVCANAATITWSANTTSFLFGDQELAGLGPPLASIAVILPVPPPNSLIGGGSFRIAAVSAVPEPSAFILMLSSGAFLVLRRRRSTGATRQT